MGPYATIFLFLMSFGFFLLGIGAIKEEKKQSFEANKKIFWLENPDSETLTLYRDGVPATLKLKELWPDSAK